MLETWFMFSKQKRRLGLMEKTQKNITARLSYAFGAFGNDMFYGALSGYFIMFVTTHLFNTGNQAQNDRMISYVTLVIAALRIVELIIDPFIGNAIDRTNTRFGRFKPWVVVGGVISSITLLILFTDLGGLSRTNPFLYLIIFAILYIILDIFYSFKDIGFWSMIPALSLDSREREKTATFARVGSTIGGGLVGVIVMPIVVAFSLNKNGGTGDNRGWFWFAFIVALVGIISAIVVGLGTKEVDSELRKNKEQTAGVKEVFKVLTKNDQLMWVALAYAFYCIGINILGSLVLYYFTFILGHSTYFSVLQMINTCISLVSVSLFPKLTSKFNRRNLFFGCIITMLCGIAVFSMANTSLPLVILGAELFFVPQPLVFLVVLMTISDSVEYGQWKLGHRDESLTLSVRPLLDKLGGAISNAVVGQIAVLAGMTTGATPDTITEHGKFIFKLMMFAFPAVVLLLAIFVFYKKVILTEEKHAQIVEELEKSWGKKVDGQTKALVQDLEIPAPIAGKVITLSEVKDANFARGSLGQGFGIIPSDGRVYAPFDCTIRSTFSTRHAVGIEGDNGVTMLIHIGIGTVNMKGTGFVTYFEEGQRIKKGDLLIEFWDPAIKKAGYDDTVIVTITNSNKYAQIEMLVKDQDVDTTTNVLKIKA